MARRKNPMYPMFLDLEGTDCLVVGGGAVAERKVESLLECGAKVTVVSPQATDALRSLAAEGKAEFRERAYEAGEAARYFLVIAATNDEAANKMISEDARAAGRLVNVVDVPDLCGFYVPASVRRGELTKAISTGGAAPALAKKIRRDLEAAFPPSYAALLEKLREFREKLIQSEPDEKKRMRIMSKVAGSPEIEMFLKGDEAPLGALLKECV